MSRKHLTLQPDGAILQIELDLQIAGNLLVLPDDPSLYFDLSEAHLLIPLNQLVTLPEREESIRDANHCMQVAASGNRDKQKPLTVLALGDDLWLVVDGNSTLINARHSNWRVMPCIMG